MLHTLHKTKHPLHMMLHEKKHEEEKPRVIQKKIVPRTVTTRKRASAPRKKIAAKA